MHFTRTSLKNKKIVKYATNKMGQYYSNERVPIKNYNTTSIAERIDKNMTNLNVPENLTNKNLNQFIKPIIDRIVLEPETIFNIFNYNYDNINIETGLAERTRVFEDEYYKIKLVSNNDVDIFNYKFDSINMNVGLAEKIQKFEEEYDTMKLTLNINIDVNIFNYNYDTINLNVGLAEKIKKFEEDYDATKLTLNKDINIFNYNYDTINMNVGLAEKIKKFEDDYEERKVILNKDTDIFNYNYDNIHLEPSLADKIKKIEDEYKEVGVTLTKDTSTNINLKTGNNHFNSFLTILTEPNNHINNNINNINNHVDEEYINKSYTKSQITAILKVLQLTKVTIENVYQETYGPNINATGIGDFIRGSYFLMQFCQESKLFYNINMLNHPVCQFLDFYKNKQPLHYKNINKFDLTNFNPIILDDNILTNIYDNTINNDFTYFLKDQTVHNKKIYTYIIAYPTIIIDEEHKKYMRQLLKPTKYLSLLIDEQLTKLKLTEKEFSVIHVRYGDNFLIKKESDIKINHLTTIEKTINRLDPNQKILLISDNIIIKNILRTKYLNIKTHFNEITHTGEGVKLDTNKLKNTMIDFYLFSRAKNVFAFSVYKHGTGFSKWATETYSVPYICRFLQ
jgi:hypothetical protein